MADSICKNGKTLQVLNMTQSFVHESTYPYSACYRPDKTVPNGNLQSIIKCCQELKEVDLNYINGEEGLIRVDHELLVRNIPPKVDKVKIMLSRCNKIKALSLEACFMTDDSLTYTY